MINNLKRKLTDDIISNNIVDSNKFQRIENISPLIVKENNNLKRKLTDDININNIVNNNKFQRIENNDFDKSLYDASLNDKFNYFFNIILKRDKQVLFDYVKHNLRNNYIENSDFMLFFNDFNLSNTTYDFLFDFLQQLYKISNKSFGWIKKDDNITLKNTGVYTIPLYEKYLLYFITVEWLNAQYKLIQ